MQMTPFEKSESIQSSDSMYDDYADNFDLSLLSVDNAISSSVGLEQQQQQQQHSHDTQTRHSINAYDSIEQTWYNSGSNSSSTPLSPPKTITNRNDFIPTVFPPSPTPSIECTAAPALSSPSTGFTVIKSEPQTYSSHTLYPPSPPDSNGAPSPVGYHHYDHYSVKSMCSEPSIDASFFQCSTSPASSTMSTASSSIDSIYGCYSNESLLMRGTMETIYAMQQTNGIEASNKNQLIDDYLQDLCEQKKLRSTLDAIFGDDIEPVLSLAMEQARKDVEQTCMTLNISSGTFFLCVLFFSFFSIDFYLVYLPKRIRCLNL